MSNGSERISEYFTEESLAASAGGFPENFGGKLVSSSTPIFPGNFTEKSVLDSAGGFPENFSEKFVSDFTETSGENFSEKPLSDSAEGFGENFTGNRLCGVGGCVRLAGHAERHTWEVHEWCGILCALKASEARS